MRNSSIVARALCALLAVACLTARAEPDAPPRVLFVGNSYTYFNNLPALFAAVGQFSRDDQRAPETAMVVAPGATLSDLAEGFRYEALLKREHFDYVVLQERGGVLACMTSAQRPPPVECTVSIKAHRQMAKLAQAAGAKVIVFGTWPMRPGEQGPVSRGTRQLASRLHLPYVDVGAALQSARAADQTLALFLPDDHPDRQGSLLAAIALWRAIGATEVPARDFRAEVPEFTGMKPLRAKPRAAAEPPPRLIVIEASAAQMNHLIEATRPR